MEILIRCGESAFESSLSQLKYCLTLTFKWKFLFMESFLASLPANWEEFLKCLADDHEIDGAKVIGGLCDWAFSGFEYKAQFEVWLDKAYPSKGQAKDSVRAEGE